MLHDKLEFKTNKMNLLKKGIAILILACIPKTMQATDHVDTTHLLIQEILQDEQALDYFSTLHVQNFHKILNVMEIGEEHVQDANNKINLLTAQFKASGDIAYKNKIAQILGYKSDAQYQKALAAISLKKSQFDQKYSARITNLEDKEVFKTELNAAMRSVSSKFTRCFDSRIKILTACLGIAPTAFAEFRLCLTVASLADIAAAVASDGAGAAVIIPEITWEVRVCSWIVGGAFGGKALATDCVKAFIGILAYCMYR